MQKNSGATIAIVHIPIELGKFEYNMHKIEEIAERAKNENVDILMLPAMTNGVPIFDIRKNLRIKIISETIPGKTSDYLARIAYKFNLYIISGPILERRGSRLYRSVFIVDPAMNIKSVISQMHTPVGFSQSSVIPVAMVKNINIGIFIAEDIHLPELSLLMKIVGVDTVIFYPYPQISIDKVVAMLKTRALELRTMVISTGYIARRKDEEVLFMPTAIVDENGIIVHEVLDRSQKIIKIFISRNKSHESSTPSLANRKLLKILGKALMYHLKQGE